MSTDERNNSDALLKAVSESEEKGPKGHLKIFFGMAAGVGKTYAMLEEAHKRVQEGVNLVVGIVDAHGRVETLRLLQGLKILPEKKITYRERTFNELDIDEILKIKPELVLVDELAHSNIPGSRHPKRWQDVMEILDAGIDVYTTLNIQHIESRKEIVEAITGITIHETVPDLVLEIATDIELVDITPDELIQRLKEGKVYTGELSTIAIENFFQEDRLTALREIALRLTAEKVDHELHEMISAFKRGKGWKPRDRLLVHIDHTLYSQQLIRATRRLSFHLDAPWIALYVDQGAVLDEEESAQLSKNLSLARELGAEVITVSDPSPAVAIQRVAEQKGATQVIVGRPSKGGFFSFWKRFLLFKKLSDKSSGIDIHIIRQPFALPQQKRDKGKKVPLSTLSPYLRIFFWIVLLTIFNALLLPLLGYKVIGFIFLLSIVILSLFFRIGPILFAAILSALLWIFFIPPLGDFVIDSSEDIAFVIFYFITVIILGVLTQRIRLHQELLIKREQSTQAIYDIVREIASAPSSAQIFKAIKDHLGSILKGRCEILNRHYEDGLDFQEAPLLAEDEKEKAVAQWAYEKGREAGWSTSTLPSVKNLYIPLKGSKEVMGVLAFRPFEEKPLLPEESNFLRTVAQELAYFLERTLTEERERKAKQLDQIEKIYEKVLSSISHELRHPLDSLQQAITRLKKEEPLLEKKSLLPYLYQLDRSFGSLSRIATNSEAMAELSTGLITFHKEAHDIPAFLSACCKKTKSSHKDHPIDMHIAPNLPPITFDGDLIEILLGNLLSNAIEYSPPHSKIEVDVEVVNEFFILSISDQGKGIPEDMMDLVFERFYRVPGTTSTGIGLGLAIAKSIAEMHHGMIKAENRKEGGAKFSLILPLNLPED